MQFDSFDEIIQSIEFNISKQLFLPALILIYTGIDILGYIAYGEIKVKDRFTRWVDEYMYRLQKQKQTSMDLYAARCSILHTLTSESDLYKNGKAKRIFYAWGDASLDDLNKAINHIEHEEILTLNINDLYILFQNGYLLFIESDKFC